MLNWVRHLALHVFLVFVMTSCGRRSLEDFREEGEGVTRSLITELQIIQTREDLVQASPELTHLFNQLVDIAIAAREFHEKHPGLEPVEITKKDQDLNEHLRVELNRLYGLDGGRELIEKCQDAALNKLVAFEKRTVKAKTTSKKYSIKK